MKRNAISGLLMILLAPLLVTGPYANAKDRDDHNLSCIPVSGSIAANLTGDGQAQGTVTGDLRGSVTASFRTTPQSNGNIVLELHHIFVTEAGDSLTTDDTGLLVPVPNTAGVFRMTVQYTITGGTGKFATASGTLANHGEAILSSNPPQLILRYSGRVCVHEHD